jgi:hypothetical protein
MGQVWVMVLFVSVLVAVAKRTGEFGAQMCRLTWQKVTGRAEMLIRSALLAPVSLARTALMSETRRVWKMRWQERVAESGYCCPLQLVESGYCCP